MFCKDRKLLISEPEGLYWELFLDCPTLLSIQFESSEYNILRKLPQMPHSHDDLSWRRFPGILNQMILLISLQLQWSPPFVAPSRFYCQQLERGPRDRQLI